MVYSPKKLIAFIATVAAALSLQACGPMPNSSNQPAQPTATGKQEPAIEATPVKQGENNWLVAGGDTVTLNVTALGAKSARILYRPIDAGDRVVALKKNPTATDNANGTFSTQIKLSPDFGGEVWAEVTYADGS